MSPPNESTVACYTPAGNGAIAPRPPPTAGATQKRRSVLRFAKLQSDRLLASGLDRKSSDPEPARRNRCADHSEVKNPRPSAAPDRVRRETCDSGIAQRGREGTLTGTPAAPKVLVPGHRHGPYPALQLLWPLARPPPVHSKIRGPVAGVRGCPALTRAGPARFGVGPRPRPSLSGRRSDDQLCSSRQQIFQRAWPRRNVARKARAACPSTRASEFRALRRYVRATAAECFAAGCCEPRPAPAHA